MGQKIGGICSGGSVQSLVQKFKPQIIQILSINMGKQMLSQNFVNIKQKIASQFNKMAPQKKNQNLFNSLIQKIDTDQEQQNLNLQGKKQSLGGLLNIDQKIKNQVLALGGQKYATQIKTKCQQLINPLKDKFNISKYINF